MDLFSDYGSMLAALCIWRESRGEGLEAKRGVFHVLNNRVKASGFPKDLTSVVLQPWQFSSFNANDPNATKFPRPNDPGAWVAWKDSCEVVETPGEDPTGGAVFYESFPPDLLDGLRVGKPWFKAELMTVQIGKIRFYRAA